MRYGSLVAERKRLLTIRELREFLGEDRVGRDLAYRLARKYGIRLGRRLLVPTRVADAIAEGRLEEVEKESAACKRHRE